MIERIRIWADNKWNDYIGCQVRDKLFMFIMLSIMIPISIITHNYIFPIVLTIIMDRTHDYRGGFHCKGKYGLEKCILFTNTIMIIGGYLTKSTLDYIGLTFVLCLFCMKDIISKAPVGDSKCKTIHICKQKLTYLMF